VVTNCRKSSETRRFVRVRLRLKLKLSTNPREFERLRPIRGNVRAWLNAPQLREADRSDAATSWSRLPGVSSGHFG